MSRPIIAVDVDEVLFPFSPNFLVKHNREHGTSMQVSDLNTYFFIQELYKEVDDPEDICEAYLHEAYAGNIGPYSGAIEAINSLKDRYELSVITARRPSMLAITEKWLNRYFPDVFKGIHFPRSRSEVPTKAQVCAEIGAKYLIDDHPSNIEGIVEQSVTVLLFGDYPWNKTIDSDEGVVRVADWQAVVEYFDGRH